MSVFDKVFRTSATEERLQERQALNAEHRATLKNPPEWLTWAFGAQPSQAGISVTEEKSLQVTAVFAAIQVIADAVAGPPLRVFRKNGENREPVDHPLNRIFNLEGNDYLTGYDMRHMLMTQVLLWENAYGEITIDGAGQINGIWPLNPTKVTPKPSGRGVVYEIYSENRTLPADRVIHLRGVATHGVKASSRIRLAREAIGTAMAAEHYGARFFKNDATPPSVLEYPGKLTEAALTHLRDSWLAQQGGENQHKTAILDHGGAFKAVGVDPEKSQLNDTRTFQVREIARLFKVPPHKLGDLADATFSNVEQQNMEFVQETMRPWIIRSEQEFMRKLLTRREQDEGLYLKHNLNERLRADTQARGEFYNQLWQIGALTANQVRALEEMNPVDGGDKAYVPMNMIPANEPRTDENMRGAERRTETRALPPRYRIARSLLPMLRDTFSRANKREIVEIRRAVDSFLVPNNVEGFRSFVDAFEEEHAEWLMERGRILPLYQTFARQMADAAEDEVGGEIEPDEQFTQDYARAYANRHVGSTAGQLRALTEEDEPLEAVQTRLDEWEETRAEKEANRERVRAGNAFTKVAWAVAGVSVIKWRNTGSSTCPMCTHLDGRAVSITRFFVNAGDEVPNTDGTNLTVRTNIGHPPLHQGCDCLILPEVGRGAITDTEYRSLKEMLL